MRHRSAPRTLAAIVVALAALAACSDDDASSDTVVESAGVESTVAESTIVESTVATSLAPTTTDAPTTEPAATVAHIRGTAYTFNTPDPIAGATIKVAEHPELSATTAADGSYELELPAGSTATLYIEAADHFGIHTQTFTLTEDGDGLELDGVNLQTPSLAVYEGLKALVGGFTGRDPFEGGCVIVTTVGDARMVGMTFAEFIDFHPHGVEGATVAIEPALATPIYFNEQVLPDVAQLTSSIDGGVLFPNVPPGEYTLTATKDGMEFATVHATCENGRVVNANPVWGLHALP
ncbi:MAG: hypothetical protein Q8M22_21305 [Actinomycetota bacterium]|nr:hypothetical protein [Actinomycetota bacterium]